MQCREFTLPKQRLPKIVGQKFVAMKLRDGFMDRSWADYISYLVKKDPMPLLPNPDTIIESGTLKTLLPMWLSNFSDNLPYIKNGDKTAVTHPEGGFSLSISDLAEEPVTAVPKGTAIVIGRGPSVFKHKHLDLLAEAIQSRKYLGKICASDGMLIDCLQKNIIPDLTVSVDGAPIIKKWFNHPLVKEHGSELNVVLPVTIHNSVYQICVENRCKVHWYLPLFDSIECNESFTRIMRGLTRTAKYPDGLVMSQAGGNAGAFAWIMAVDLLKRSPVALIGIDFGYPEGTNLETTPYFSNVTNTSQIDDLYKDIYHPYFKTYARIDMVFSHYRKAFLDMQKQTPIWYHQAGGTINATEGGTLFGERITCMNFADFLKEYKV